MNKAKVIKSLIYKFIERFSVKSIGLVISIIQARLLAPEVFGQLSLLLVFTDLSLTVVDGGLNSALVQSKEVKERDYSTVFIITLGLTAVVIVLLYFAAPLIAGYYQSPALYNAAAHLLAVDVLQRVQLDTGRAYAAGDALSRDDVLQPCRDADCRYARHSDGV